jgi:hypothetical protein
MEQVGEVGHGGTGIDADALRASVLRQERIRAAAPLMLGVLRDFVAATDGVGDARALARLRNRARFAIAAAARADWPRVVVSIMPIEAAQPARRDALRAAAPELYGALRDVLRIARAASGGVTGNQARLARAERAIAAAEGRS